MSLSTPRRLTLRRDLLEDTIFPDLPEDVGIEILKRLPVKSLLKFRCVSKIWLAVISSPGFNKTLLNFQSENANKVIIFAGLSSKMSLFSIMDNKSSNNPMTCDRSLVAPEGAFRFLGSCNGLLCFRAKAHKIIVWNPATRKIKEIPDVWGCAYRSFYGFGVNKENDNFKIVYAYRVDKDREYEVLVYSFKSGFWEKIQGGFSSGIIGNIPVCVSGALNWCNKSLASNNWHWDIISFDLATHTSRNIALPNYEMCDAVHIRESRGLLFASCFHKHQMSAWVMNEYGVEESWTMLVSVPNLPRPQRGMMISDSVSVVFVSKDFDILMKFQRCLRLYKSKTKRARSFKITGPLIWGTQAINYVETLFSLHLPNYEVGDQDPQ